MSGRQKSEKLDLYTILVVLNKMESTSVKFTLQKKN